jgi:hypothetical protein
MLLRRKVANESSTRSGSQAELTDRAQPNHVGVPTLRLRGCSDCAPFAEFSHRSAGSGSIVHNKWLKFYIRSQKIRENSSRSKRQKLWRIALGHGVLRVERESDERNLNRRENLLRLRALAHAQRFGVTSASSGSAILARAGARCVAPLGHLIFAGYGVRGRDETPAPRPASIANRARVSVS